MTPARYATSGVSLQRVRELFSCHRDHFTPNFTLLVNLSVSVVMQPRPAGIGKGACL
jgi:hypothetical protein